jgi:hypothetical protein
MTDPADSDQLRNTIAFQRATIGRHEEFIDSWSYGRVPDLGENHY